MADFIAALGLVFVIEGVLYFLAPGYVKHLWQLAQSLPVQTLRNGGLASIAIGLAIVWFARAVLAG